MRVVFGFYDYLDNKMGQKRFQKQSSVTTQTTPMNIKDKNILHSIIGGMTTDYFDFFCKECGSNIPYVDFYSIDSVGVKLVTKCLTCGKVSRFKIKTSIPLGPIQMTLEKGKYGYKTYDKRRLKSYKKEIENKILEKKSSR